jgi:hypothetical protein
MANGF